MGGFEIFVPSPTCLPRGDLLRNRRAQVRSLDREVYNRDRQQRTTLRGLIEAPTSDIIAASRSNAYNRRLSPFIKENFLLRLQGTPRP